MGLAWPAAVFTWRGVHSERGGAVTSSNDDLFGSQIQGDLFGAAQWRIYHGAAKEFGSAMLRMPDPRSVLEEGARG